LSGKRATHARVLEALDRGDYDLIHFGGHAWFDDSRILLRLWDQIMLGSELAPLMSRRPALMVLDTHFTAFVPVEMDADMRDLIQPKDRSRVGSSIRVCVGHTAAAAADGYFGGIIRTAVLTVGAGRHPHRRRAPTRRNLA
jgi:hypothetical protein